MIYSSEIPSSLNDAMRKLEVADETILKLATLVNRAELFIDKSGLWRAWIKETEPHSTSSLRHGKMETIQNREVTMPKREADNDLNAMIDAGLKTADLCEIGKVDIIRREHLIRFLKAALALRSRSQYLNDKIYD